MRKVVVLLSKICKKRMYCSIEDDDVLQPLNDEIEKEQFQKVRLKYYSNELNEHRYICDIGTLSKYASTIRGKPILAYYNIFGNDGKGDFAGHEDSEFAKEIAVGFVPLNAEVTIKEDGNGVSYCYVDGYIWTLYYQHILDVFHDFDDTKGISSEVLIIQSEELEDNVTRILQMSFAGITLLGSYDFYHNAIKPAVNGCKADLVSFAALRSEYNKAKTVFEKHLYSNNVTELSDESSFLSGESKEGSMEKDEKVMNSDMSVTQKEDNATEDKTVETKIEITAHKYGDKGEYLGTSHESHKYVQTTIEEVDEEESKDNPIVANASDGSTDVEDTTVEENESKEIKCDKPVDDVKESGADDEPETQDEQEDENNSEDVQDNATDLAQALARCAELEKELATCRLDLNVCKTKLSETMKKCESLAEYKKNKEMESVNNAIHIALNNVADVLSASQMSEWQEKALKCSVDTANQFINELKAFAFDVQTKNGKRQRDMMRNSISKSIQNQDVLPTNVWERVESLYGKED